MLIFIDTCIFISEWHSHSEQVKLVSGATLSPGLGYYSLDSWGNAHQLYDFTM